MKTSCPDPGPLTLELERALFNLESLMRQRQELSFVFFDLLRGVAENLTETAFINRTRSAIAYAAAHYARFWADSHDQIYRTLSSDERARKSSSVIESLQPLLSHNFLPQDQRRQLLDFLNTLLACGHMERVMVCLRAHLSRVLGDNKDIEAFWYRFSLCMLADEGSLAEAEESTLSDEDLYSAGRETGMKQRFLKWWRNL